ncbi:MAG: glycoside hydrolase family 16 protein [Deinococcota bacterium]
MGSSTSHQKDFPANPKDKAGYHLQFCDDFQGDSLNTANWLTTYLPQWASRASTQPRYSLVNGQLHLRIDQDQQPWSPEYNGNIRVSNLQTGCYSGPVGSRLGQHPFRNDLIVKEAQPTVKLYTPTYGYIETRLKAVALPGYLSALWMIGVEEDPSQSAEICICEIKGENVGAHTSQIGYGLHPFNDPTITDAFYEDLIDINAAQFHVYAVDWMPDKVAFYIDNEHIRTIPQSPTYSMQLMLNIYELPDALAPASSAAPFPKTMIVDYVRGYQKVDR